jgi:hypothetical protein
MTEMQETEIIRGLADDLWSSVVQFCNQVLQHSKIYGFALMDMPDPNVHKICDALENAVLPVLERLVLRPELADEHQIKIANVKQYIWHLQTIVRAIHDGDEPGFEAAIQALDGESFLPVAVN